MRIVTPPALEPVTLAQAKTWLRVDYDADDDLIATLIRAAREKAEHHTNRHFLTTTVEEKFTAGDPAVLNHGPVLAIVSVRAGDQVVDPSEYSLLECAVYPQVLHRIAPASAPVTIQYTVGYGPNLADVPVVISQAILLMVGEFYENRTDGVRRMPTASQHLLNTVRRWIT